MDLGSKRHGAHPQEGHLGSLLRNPYVLQEVTHRPVHHQAIAFVPHQRLALCDSAQELSCARLITLGVEQGFPP